MNDILKLARIQIGVIILFIFNKLLLRPYVLENEFPMFFKIFVLSFPNFCEAIIGTLSITYIGLYINSKSFIMSKLNEQHIYLFATIAAGIYVILQEIKIHNLGGKNTYDPYDVLFSLMGLIITCFFLFYMKPKVDEFTSNR